MYENWKIDEAESNSLSSVSTNPISKEAEEPWHRPILYPRVLKATNSNAPTIPLRGRSTACLRERHKMRSVSVPADILKCHLKRDSIPIDVNHIVPSPPRLCAEMLTCITQNNNNILKSDSNNVTLRIDDSMTEHSLNRIVSLSRWPILREDQPSLKSPIAARRPANLETMASHNSNKLNYYVDSPSCLRVNNKSTSVKKAASLNKSPLSINASNLVQSPKPITSQPLSWKRNHLEPCWSHNFSNQKRDALPTGHFLLPKDDISNGWQSCKSLNRGLSHIKHENEGSQDIICRRCGRCKCASCKRLKRMPPCCIVGPSSRRVECSIDCFSQFLSCQYCLQAIFYHCLYHQDDEDEDEDAVWHEPCSCCTKPRCCARWTIILSLVPFLPCLLLYLPLKCFSDIGSLCYDACCVKQRGCRCEEFNDEIYNHPEPSSSSSATTREQLLDSECSTA